MFMTEENYKACMAFVKAYEKEQREKKAEELK
jgi:hypothetical protein